MYIDYRINNLSGTYFMRMLALSSTQFVHSIQKYNHQHWTRKKQSAASWKINSVHWRVHWFPPLLCPVRVRVGARVRTRCQLGHNVAMHFSSNRADIGDASASNCEHTHAHTLTYTYESMSGINWQHTQKRVHANTVLDPRYTIQRGCGWECGCAVPKVKWQTTVPSSVDLIPHVGREIVQYGI